MRIKILEYANEKNTNKECVELEENGFVIIDIVYTHHTVNHYIAYAVIKYKEKEEKQDRECKHKNTTPEYDYVSCNDCGSIKTDGGSGWGMAKNKWFNNKYEADYFKSHGCLPEYKYSSK